MHANSPNCCARIFGPVYQEDTGLRTLKELSRSYLTISKDLGRVISCVT